VHFRVCVAIKANVIVAGEVRLPRCPALRGGIVPGDENFTAWSYRGRSGTSRRAFLAQPQPLTAQTAHECGSDCRGCAERKALPEHGKCV